MNENVKSAVFAGVALVLFVVALSTRAPVANSDGMGLGELMFPKFKNSLNVYKVEIVEFDEKQGDADGITVERKDAGWSITTYNGYPADAQDQLEKAVDLLSGLEKLSIETEEEGDHENYGVGDPTKAKIGDEGVGRLIRLSGSDGGVLASLIIGKEFELEDSSQNSSPGDLFYVRIPGQPAVFTTRLQNPSAIKSGFTDWVERDLLSVKGGHQFASSDVSSIALDQHKIDQDRLSPGPIFSFRRGENNNGWLESSGSDLKPGRHELINTNSVDELRDAFGDLEITGVEPKPDILAANLLSGVEFLADTAEQKLVDIAESLDKKGFAAVRSGLQKDGAPVLGVRSNQGEVRVGMSEGIEYLMRFGSSFKSSTGTTEDDSRHIYVLARLNEDLLDKPEFSEPPKPPADLDTNATARTNLEKLQAEIDRKNQELQSEFETKRNEAQRHVAQLNAKYAKWYYVISEETFNKIQVEREDLVKEKKINASHILVSYKGAKDAGEKITRTKDEAKKRSNDIHSQVTAKDADFAKIAEKESDDPGSKLSGGALGGFTFSGITKDINADFADAAFSLDVNGTSPVFESPAGFHIIHRTAPPPPPPSGASAPGPPAGGFPHGGGLPPGLIPRN
jgi:hypothetical protein